MLFAAGGQCACMAVLAGTVANGSKSAGIMVIVILFLFKFFLAEGLPAEFAPLALWTRATAVTTVNNCIFTFLVVEITPISISSIGKSILPLVALRPLL